MPQNTKHYFSPHITLALAINSCKFFAIGFEQNEYPALTYHHTKTVPQKLCQSWWWLCSISRVFLIGLFTHFIIQKPTKKKRNTKKSYGKFPNTYILIYIVGYSFRGNYTSIKSVGVKFFSCRLITKVKCSTNCWQTSK